MVRSSRGDGRDKPVGSACEIRATALGGVFARIPPRRRRRSSVRLPRLLRINPNRSRVGGVTERSGVAATTGNQVLPLQSTTCIGSCDGPHAPPRAGGRVEARVLVILFVVQKRESRDCGDLVAYGGVPGSRCEGMDERGRPRRGHRVPGQTSLEADLGRNRKLSRDCSGVPASGAGPASGMRRPRPLAVVDHRHWMASSGCGERRAADRPRFKGTSAARC